MIRTRLWRLPALLILAFATSSLPAEGQDASQQETTKAAVQQAVRDVLVEQDENRQKKLDEAVAKAKVEVARPLSEEEIEMTGYVALGVFMLFLLMIWGVVSLQSSFKASVSETIDKIASGNGDYTKRDSQVIEALRLFQLSPFGVPDGTVRAIIALSLVCVGLLILLTQKAIGLSGVGEVAGLLGTVLGFYFGTRTGDSGTQQQARTASDNANTAAIGAVQAVAKADEALQAARTATTQAQEARTASATAEAMSRAGTVAAPIADAQSVDTQQKLTKYRSYLEVNRQITRALQQQRSGANVAGDVESTLTKVDALIGAIDLATKGKLTGQELQDVLQRTEALVPQLEQVGMPAVFGDAIATLKGAAVDGIKIATVAGGPAGIIGGLVLAGLKLRDQQEKFQKWQRAVLQQPYNQAALPAMVTDTVAAIIIEQTELAEARLAKSPADKAFNATEIVKSALKREAGSSMPLPALAVAGDLLKNTAGFTALFKDADELAEAVEEVRQSVLFVQVLEGLPPAIEIVPADAPAMSVQLRALLQLIPLLRRDSRVATELERITAVLEVLKNQTGFTTDELLPVVLDALKSGEKLAETSRQITEIPRPE